MDLNRALRTATKTGEVQFGVSQARKAIETKHGKLIVIASNCPAPELKEQKIFSISVVTVIAPGESQILSK